MMITSTQKNVDADFVDQLTPNKGILSLMLSGFLVVAITITMSLVFGCAQTKQPRTYSLTVNQTIQIPPGTQVIKVANLPAQLHRRAKTAGIILDAGHWSINVKGQSKDEHTPTVSPNVEVDAQLKR